MKIKSLYHRQLVMSPIYLSKNEIINTTNIDITSPENLIKK